MADASARTDGAGDADRGPASRRFERDEVEFSRAINFFDATFAIATTLLVTTLTTSADQWSSWPAFRHDAFGPLFAYALSFVVVSTFWWRDHRFVASLSAITPKLIGVSIVMLGFVVLLPFSTTGLGTASAESQITTVIYAINVVAVSISGFALHRVAIAEGLYAVAMTKAAIFEHTITILDTPLVFLASVPVALFWSADGAKYMWLLLVPWGIGQRRWLARRARNRRGTTRPVRPSGSEGVGDRPT